MGLDGMTHRTISALFTEPDHPTVPELKVEPQIVLTVGENLPRIDISIWPKSATVAAICKFSLSFPAPLLKTTTMDSQTLQNRTFPDFFITASEERSIPTPCDGH
jgi:hypothetical protein